eukprot:TRINITY_DN4264_c0_g1_i6.p1 TRINITY_DN4264_c0_g1~~TRINITY_DN4264_c0_g1_i6.p1  ORF type:complete len:721 (+),score=127.13 TRINITY_DN4264_c0_g1_i6:3473-5635(+)
MLVVIFSASNAVWTLRIPSGLGLVSLRTAVPVSSPTIQQALHNVLPTPLSFFSLVSATKHPLRKISAFPETLGPLPLQGRKAIGSEMAPCLSPCRQCATTRNPSLVIVFLAFLFADYTRLTQKYLSMATAEGDDDLGLFDSDSSETEEAPGDEGLADIAALLATCDEDVEDDAPVELMASCERPDQEWTAQAILGRRRKKEAVFYKVRWSSGEASWEREEDLDPDLLDRFNAAKHVAHTLDRQTSIDYTTDRQRRRFRDKSGKRPVPRKEPGEKVQISVWESQNPRNGVWGTYEHTHCILLDKALEAGQARCALILGGMRFTVDFSDMHQYNTTGGSRPVRRTDQKIAVSPQAVAAALKAAPPEHVPDEEDELECPAVALQVAEIPEIDVAACTAALQRVETVLHELEKTCAQPLAPTAPEGKKGKKGKGKAEPPTPPPAAEPAVQHDIDRADVTLIVALYDQMLARFNQQEFQRKYGAGGEDAHLLHLRADQQVPEYFANVGGQSIFQRKVLSMQGLRNLVIHGREIFRELREHLFIGDYSAYPGMTGLNKMKHYTGNTVDLDTCVLRCSDRVTLQTINMINRHKKEPEFGSPDEFGASQQAQDIARAQAATLMDAFAQEFGLTTEQQRQQRRVHVPPAGEAIPVARSNTDRGRWPIWQYINVGVNSFHANVPTMPDVIGALLKAPFHCARAYLLSQDDLPGFFEEAVADSCFNRCTLL